MWNINAPQYPLRDFHKICRICTPFQDALDVKISLDLLKRLHSYGGFKLRGSGSPKCSAPLASDPKNWNFYSELTEMWNINAQTHKICRVCTTFQDALGVKIWLDLLKGLWSYGGFKLRGSGYPPNFQRPLAAKLCVRPPNVFEVKERARGPLSPRQVWWGSDFTRRRGSQKR